MALGLARPPRQGAAWAELGPLAPYPRTKGAVCGVGGGAEHGSPWRWEGRDIAEAKVDSQKQVQALPGPQDTPRQL